MAPRETFGPYVIHEALGVGGMATVHRAVRGGPAGAPIEVALKRMLPAIAESEEGLAYFLREAQLASYLRHENVALTHELGEIGGTYYIAMELIRGTSLHAIMARCAEVASPMPIAVALAIIDQILAALEYAHDLRDPSGQPLGIIHRDVSPPNILVGHDGITKLIDFGIAKASAAGMQTMNLTLKGKWAYMAPEYVELGEIDARADLFAAGVLAHELLVGRALFSAADDLATLERVRTLPIPPPSHANRSVPAELDPIVMAALARDPTQRWQTASAMRGALAVATDRLGLAAEPSYVARWLADLFGDGGAATGARASTEREDELLELVPEPAPPPADPRSLAQILSDTNQVPALGGPRLPRAMTGAEPLTDFEASPLPIRRARVTTPPVAAFAVSVHEKKAAELREKVRRGLIIAASVVVTLGLAAAAYLAFG